MVLAGLSIIHVPASTDVLTARLCGRGRETAQEIAVRIEREAEPDPDGMTVINIDNFSDLSAAKAALIAAVHELSK